MITVKKVSEITTSALAEYIHVSTEDDGTTEKLLQTFLSAAIGFIKSYINQNDDYLDENSEFVEVVFVLCQDMHDNRTLYPDRSNLNYFVKATLDMHCGGLVV